MTRRPTDNKDRKKMANTQIKKTVEVVGDLIFRPSYEQVQVKAAFWAKFSANPLTDTQNIDLPTAQKFVNDPRLEKWWTHYGFKEWFLNEEEFLQRLQAIAFLALGTLEEVLMNPDANPSARVNAAKLAFEAANKMPQKWQKGPQYLDTDIQKMDQAQLENFLRQKSLAPAGETDDSKEK
jgi:hypothetical protein